MPVMEPMIEGATSAGRTVSHKEWTVLLLALVVPSLATYVYFIWLGGQPAMRAAYSITKTLQFSLPLIWVWLILRERVSFGLGSARGLGLGLAFGAAVFAVTLGIYFGWLKGSPAFAGMQAGLQDKVGGMGALSPVRFILLGAFISVIHSFLEEYYWRWFVFGRMRRLVSLTTAIVISSLGFMAHHVLVLGAYIDMEHWPVIAFLSVSVAVGGAFWAWLYHKTDSLIAPWISHLMVDAALIVAGYDQLWGL